MLKKIKSWLFPTSYDGFKYDSIDRDGDGVIQEGTKFERKADVVKKTAKKAPVKKAAVKKPVAKKVAKKAPVKKAPVKKAAKKK